MMAIRRLPPLLSALWLLALLATLASLAVNTWAWILGQQSGGPPERKYLVGFALLELSLVYNWMVVAYNVRHPTRVGPVRRPAHSAPWLDAPRGQLITACIGSALPLATIVSALAFPNIPLVFWAFPANMLFLIVWYAVLGWAMV